MRSLSSHIYIGICVLLLASCAPSANETVATDGTVEIDFDKTQDYTIYQSFSWASERPMVVFGEYPVSDETEAHLMSAIKSALAKKGFQYVASPVDAEFAVSFTVGAKYDVEFLEEPKEFWDGYEFSYGETGADIARESVEGRLAIDIFDIERLTRVWHGVGSKELTFEERLSNDRIDGDVETILSDFPPK